MEMDVNDNNTPGDIKVDLNQTSLELTHILSEAPLVRCHLQLETASVLAA